jgi:hypothetical protein
LWDNPEDDEEEESMVSLDELDAYPTAEEE